LISTSGFSSLRSGSGDGKLEMSPVTTPIDAAIATARGRGGGLGKISTLRTSHFMADERAEPASAPLESVPSVH
jgi:hypothetical protein